MPEAEQKQRRYHVSGNGIPRLIPAVPFFLFLLFLAIHSTSAVEKKRTFTEYEVKASFLYKFTKFITWPDEKTQENVKTLRIGILGEDPFEDTIDRLLAGKQVQNKPIEIIRADKVDDLAQCHIVFISASEEEKLESILATLETQHILTVSDSQNFSKKGVMINLVTIKNKIHLEINPSHAKEAHLKISSQLLSLATIIE